MTSSGDGPLECPWSLSVAEALEALRSGEHGLSTAEASRRVELYGPNELRAAATVSIASIVLRQFASPLIYILMAAAALTIVLGEYVDAAVIGAVLALNAVIGFSQEYRAERSMEALLHLARTRARVMRDRHEHEVDAAGLVPGDIVVLEAGMKVPADSRLIHSSSLEVDESLLTGESATVAKSTAALPPEAGLGDRLDMAFMGTVVTRGRGRAVVVSTGEGTELGRIAESVEEVGVRETPLQERLRRFAHIVGVAVLASSLAAFLAGVAAGEPLHDLFLAMVALAVAAIPEGLPIVLTVALAISVRRMAARNAIIRRLPAVETLGSCTVIGSDKTGTLTENKMTVRELYAGSRTFQVTGRGYEPGGEILVDGAPARLEESSPEYLALLAGLLCNDSSIVERNGELAVHGDPTEIALLVAAAKADLSKDELDERFPRWAEIPFDSEQRYAATFHHHDGRGLVFVKGAPELVLDLCADAAGAPALDRAEVHAQADRMAGAGLRVLAMAYRELPDAGSDREVVERTPHGLVFLGLQGMMDPPREEVRTAIRGCQLAGIRVLMITGDHATTAASIAQELGIAVQDAPVLSGSDVERLHDDELEARVRDVSVYARMAPEHKLRIVRALQRVGDIVAVTGDGVNDAPALKAADIGAAMGRTGTDVAKEASDMVVADDNFASIFAAVEEGRIAFDNVRKTTFFLISTGAASILAVVVSILFRFPLPLLPAQLLWLNLVTNGVQDVALAFEPGEKNVLERPPRPRREGVISRLLWERTALAGVVMAAGTLLLFLVERQGESIEYARTVALTTMVMFQVFHVGNSRSEFLSVFAKSPFSNPFLFVGTSIAVAVHAAALYLPATQFILRVEPLDASTWAQIVAVASTVIVAIELHKRFRPRTRGVAP